MAKLPYTLQPVALSVSGPNIVAPVTLTDATGRVVLSETYHFPASTPLRDLLGGLKESVLASIYADLTLADLAGVTLGWQIGLDTTMRQLDLL